MQVQITGLDVLTVSIVVIFVGRFLTTHIAVLHKYNIPPGDQVLSRTADDAARPALNQFTPSFDHKPNRTGNTGGRVAAALAGAGCSSLGAALPRPLVISSLIPATSS